LTCCLGFATNCVSAPGTGGLDQYCETVPGAGGGKPSDGPSEGAVQRGRDALPPGVSGSVGDGIVALVGEGPAGERSGKRGGAAGSGSGGGLSGGEVSDSPLTAVANSIEDGPTIGAWLPLSLLVIAVGAVGLFLARRARTGS
jgi:hypothetical protein